jgi:hypothetical protein
MVPVVKIKQGSIICNRRNIVVEKKVKCVKSNQLLWHTFMTYFFTICNL